MGMFEYDSTLDLTDQLLQANMNAWHSKRSWRPENLRYIEEDLRRKGDALRALANETTRMGIGKPYEPIIRGYINSVNRVPGKLIYKIRNYKHQLRILRDVPRDKLWESYGYEDQHEYNGKLLLTLLGINDITQGLVKFIDLKTGDKNPQDLWKESYDQAREWVEKLETKQPIEDISARKTSEGQFAILEMAAPVLRNIEIDMTYNAVIGVPIAHPREWKFIRDERFKRLVDYSKYIYRKATEGKFGPFRKKKVNPLAMLNVPEMTSMALREEVNFVIDEIEKIQNKSTSLNGQRTAPMYG